MTKYLQAPYIVIAVCALLGLLIYGFIGLMGGIFLGYLITLLISLLAYPISRLFDVGLIKKSHRLAIAKDFCCQYRTEIFEINSFKGLGEEQIINIFSKYINDIHDEACHIKNAVKKYKGDLNVAEYRDNFTKGGQQWANKFDTDQERNLMQKYAVFCEEAIYDYPCKYTDMSRNEIEKDNILSSEENIKDADFEVKDEVKNKKVEELWGQLSGKHNTNEVLVEKAKALAPMLLHAINRNAKILLEKIQKLENRKFEDIKKDEITIELIFFYIHLIDRISFANLRNEKRDDFMNTLLLEIRNFLSPAPNIGKDIEEFNNQFNWTYLMRQKEYGLYKKIVPEENESATNTLFWEFGKKIAGIFGDTRDVEIIFSAMDLPLEYIKTLKVTELLSDSE